MAAPRPPQPDPYLLGLDAPDLAAFHQLCELLRRRERTLTAYHSIAGLIVHLRPDGAEYGSSWVNELCNALRRQRAPISLSLAYRLLRFAEQYPGAKGTARVRRLDGAISWEVMIRVLPVESADVRESILKKAASEGMSSRAVMSLIREKVGYRRARGGRTVARPSTHPNRALRELRIWASKWPSISLAWTAGSNPVIDRARRLPPDRITDAFLADLKVVLALVEGMTSGTKTLAEDLSKLHNSLCEAHTTLKRGK